MTGPAVFRAAAGGLARGDAGMTLVEASAGTGKTRALTGIVAELVAKEGRRLDEILVVTFTRAATAELRERIRGTLRDARDAVEKGRAEDGSQAQELLAGWSRDASFDRPAAARRLEGALEEIDRANVHTIHGFCQRVLADLAFDGGFPFGFEVSGDDTELVAEAARDFWRRRMYPASRTLARLRARERLPARVARRVDPAVAGEAGPPGRGRGAARGSGRGRGGGVDGRARRGPDGVGGASRDLRSGGAARCMAPPGPVPGAEDPIRARLDRGAARGAGAGAARTRPGRALRRDGARGGLQARSRPAGQPDVRGSRPSRGGGGGASHDVRGVAAMGPPRGAGRGA